MRCGSTWLCEVLKSHPDIRIADEKEMDFFFMPRMLHHNFEWYGRHFAPPPGENPKPVRGEISPRYARLEAWQVRRIAEFLPDLRVILTLRHPIKRAWSQALYDFGRLQNKDVRGVSSWEFLRQLECARSRLSSDYTRIVRIWSEAFGRAAVHIDFFDRLKERPQDYVHGVLEHIGASTPWSLPEKFARTRIWDTTTLVKHERQIPAIVEWYIADQLLRPTEELNELLDGQVTHWVEEMRAIRGQTRPTWRIAAELNRTLCALSQRLPYAAYHGMMGIRLRQRWRRLRKPHQTPAPFGSSVAA